MSLSIRSPSMHENLKRFAHAVYVVGGAIISAAAWGYVQYSALATEAELTATVSAHDHSAESHPSMRGTLEIILKEQRELKTLVLQGRENDLALGERLVSLIAADREPDRARKAAAAAFYREEYRLLTRRGAAVEDALLEALRTPWHR